MPLKKAIKIKYFHLPGYYLLFSLIFSSCTIVKKYQPGRPFIFENTINIKGDIGKEKRDELRDDLKGQIEDSVLPRGKDIVFLIHVLKNPPRYDTNFIKQSVINMTNLLLNKGYRRGLVTYDTSTQTEGNQLRVKVSYNVVTGAMYRIDSIAYDLSDSNLQRLALQSKQGSLLKKGEPFDYNRVEQELYRLTDIFRNSGYQKITRNEIIAEGDSTIEELIDPNIEPFEYIRKLAEIQKKKDNPTIDVYIKQQPVADSTRLKQYSIGEFVVYPDVRDGDILPVKDTTHTWINGYRIVSAENLFDPAFVAKQIELKPGELYSEKKYSQTLNNFNRLGAWQNINLLSRTADSLQKVNYLLRLIPAKRQYFNVELEGSSILNSTQLAQFGSGKVGLAVNFTLRNRNIAGKAIQLENSLRTGIEFNNFSQILSNEITLTNRVTIPWSLLPLKEEIRYRNAKTIVSADISFIDRFQFYRSATFNTFIGHEWKPKPNVTWQIKFPNLEYNNVKQDVLFKQSIEDNPLLAYSFNSGFVIGASETYTKSWGKNTGHLNIIRLFSEQSGIILGGIFNSLTDTTASGKDKLFSNLFRFIKLDADYRHFIQWRKSVLAFRAFAGYGYAFQTKSNTGDVRLPFFKSYFAGGPNSLRAWQIRKLGIGSDIFLDTVVQGRFNDKFADIKLEGNVEYRFNLFPIAGVWLRGALFTDFGNIWNRNTLDGIIPNGEFKLGNLYKDLAVAAGYGLRIDFSYFLIRFDLGHPIKDPRYGPDKTGTRFASDKQNGWFVKSVWNKPTFQFAIGYPF
ncbi:MAG: BamA/TamA family outer membrane protein [Chitinophagaceae bacterium]|nr:BamA/TamA family outer membrane protein [Chitinophagaceae bacterium]